MRRQPFQDVLELGEWINLVTLAAEAKERMMSFVPINVMPA
jgi:hypothetical protein